MAAKVKKKKTIPFRFGEKHKEYIRKCESCMYNVAEGAVRAGKTVDNVFAFAHELKTTKDRIHLATGSTVGTAKLNIGDANGFGLEWIFRGQCHWGKYKDNEALFIKGPATRSRQRIVIFAGAAKEDSYKRIRGNSYGMWIATEINLHHKKTIREAFNRTIAAHRRKIFWDLNPDNPNSWIYKEYIDKYAKQAAEGELIGGYNYMHCTLYDNINLTKERIREVESQYTPGSIWYMQDIEGKRVTAQGLIYRQFAEDFNDGIHKFKRTEKPKDIMEIIIGVDFGGSSSGHAFSATAITRGYQEVVSLAAKRHLCQDENGNQIDIDPEKLGELFVDFCLQVINLYGYITVVYCDSAEQTLILGIKSSLRKSGLGWIRVENAMKEEINNRIRLTTRLMAQGRYSYMDLMCDDLVAALCSAVWDPDEITKNIRLDDGTSDIDSLDSFEYTIERDISRLIRYE